MTIDLPTLRRMLRDQGVTRLLIKRLAPNDNSKNQPYFGPDLNAVGFLPTGTIRATPTFSDKPKKSEVKFLADLDFYWLCENGQFQKAPHAKLIFYPQYPEVRFSGFLKGCSVAPSELMDPKKRGREEGRILFLGITSDKRIIGFLVDRWSPAAAAVGNVGDYPSLGIFDQLPLGYEMPSGDSRSELLRELCRISSRGWVHSQRLKADGSAIPYMAPNGGGFTLEAELGVTPNGISEPDYLGWEIKQYRVNNLKARTGGRITLMTPEPTGGFYKIEGVEPFVRRYGYPDLKGRDRLNFCGIHKANQRHPRTGLRLTLPGFDVAQGKITDPSQGVTLVDDNGIEAAIWGYASIVEHWKRKHAQAAYVPSLSRREPAMQYRYSRYVGLGVGTGLTRLLAAIAEGTIIYDPGVIMKNASAATRSIKRRSQFRVMANNLNKLYENFELVDACGQGCELI